MRLIGEGVVAPSSGRSCAFPAVCVLPGGRWICGYRAAPLKAAVGEQHSLVTWSDDEGTRWSAPIEPWTPPRIDGREGRFRAACLTALGETRVLATLYWVDTSRPELPFFNEETEGLLDSRIFHSFSLDAGETWSPPRLMDTTPLNMPTPITGPTLCLANGDWACQFELNKPYFDTSVWRHASVLMFSRDGGLTWPEHCVVTQDPDNRIFYWDQRPGLLVDGRLLDVFWTYDTRADRYLNIHARESRDHGRTWSELWDTGVPGQPAAPVSLPDGRIAMVYVDRGGAPAIKARTSADGGRSWPADTEIAVAQPVAKTQTESKQSMQDAWAEMGRFSVGLPCTALTPRGDVVVLYYAGPETDRTDVRWALLRAE